MRFEDLQGKEFGRLRVLSRADNSKSGFTYWMCVCECGTTKTVRGVSLRSGAIKSCGCLGKESLDAGRVKHNHCESPTYSSWEHMISRCNNPNNDSYPLYGGRGVRVCSRWLDFTLFLQDMGIRPAGTSIDRIDPSGDYEPSNCQWSTPIEQGLHRRNTHKITWKGETKSQEQWAKVTGLNPSTIRDRLVAGWSVDKALSTPGRGKYKIRRQL